jgi:DNA mismatch repair ATPase MutS
VARLAGVPKEILDRAKDILSHLEKPNGAVDVQKPVKGRRNKKAVAIPEKPQLDLL